MRKKEKKLGFLRRRLLYALRDGRIRRSTEYLLSRNDALRLIFDALRRSPSPLDEELMSGVGPRRNARFPFTFWPSLKGLMMRITFLWLYSFGFPCPYFVLGIRRKVRGGLRARVAVSVGHRRAVALLLATVWHCKSLSRSSRCRLSTFLLRNSIPLFAVRTSSPLLITSSNMISARVLWRLPSLIPSASVQQQHYPLRQTNFILRLHLHLPELHRSFGIYICVN